MTSPWWIAAVIAAAQQVGQGLQDYTVNKQNAAYADADAKQARLTAAAEAARQRRINRAQEGDFLAGVAAQGSDLSGSPMEAYLANLKMGEMNAQDKIYRGELTARHFEIQGDIYRKAAWNALIGAAIGAGGKASAAYSGYGSGPTTSVSGTDAVPARDIDVSGMGY